MSTITIGQIWQRPDGRNVKITGLRRVNGQKQYQLTPFRNSGRISWMWDTNLPVKLKPQNVERETWPSQTESTPPLKSGL